jgi:hypothetical protein
MSHLNPGMLLLAVVILGCLVVLIHFIVRSQVFAAVLLLLLFSLTDAIRDQVGLSTTLGGFRVSAIDLLSAVFIVVGAHRAFTIGLRLDLLGAVIALVLLLTFHFARGVADFGLQEAANSTRPWLYFLAALLFAATVPVPWGARAWHLVAITGLALVLVSIPYLLTEGIRSSSRLIVRNGQLVTDRPISAAGALVILEAAVLFLALRWPSPRASGYCAAIAVGGVLVLEHRTVWAAGLAIGLVGFATWSRTRPREDASLVFGATGLVLLAAPLAVWGILANGSFRASLQEVTANNSTFAWRTQSWQELVSSHHSPLDVLSGGPAGASWARTVFGATQTVAPHDAFVEAFLRFGAPGVALFCGLLLTLWIKRRAVSSRDGLSANAVGLIVIAVALFSITYSPGPVQGLILGILVSSLSLRGAEARAFDRNRGDRALASQVVAMQQ